MKKIFVFPALLALFAACTLQEPGEETLMMSFRAVQESSNGDSEDLPDATRTYMQGTKVLWSASDCISVFGAGSTTGVTYSINAEDAGKAEAAFTGEAVGAAPYYALYPASSSAKLSGSTLSLKLPATQSFVEGGFAPGINPMVAATNGQTMQFKNLCGIISITLSGNATIKSVKLTSMSAEPLWGDATVDMNYDGEPVLVMKSAGDESHRSITLDCGNGVSLKRTGVEFRIVVPVGSLAGGFRILVTDANGGEMAKETTGHETMRACITRMASLTYSAAKVSFQSQSEFGVYDLTNNNAKPIRTYTRVQDQYAIRYTNSGMTFRIQSIVNNYLIALKLPNSVGNNTSMTIYAYGNAGISSGTVKVNLVKQDGVKLWLEDTTNKRGYIIASDIEQ